MKRQPLHPLSDEDKQLFDTAVLMWQERLGLHDWRIERSSKKPKQRNAAEVDMFYTDRLASYRIGDDFGVTKPTVEAINRFALHEVLHVLLYPLVYQVDHKIEGDSLTTSEHSVIHALVKVLAP